MAVVPVPGRRGRTTYVVADDRSRKVAVVYPDGDTAAVVADLAMDRGWQVAVELRCVHDRAGPRLASTVLQPEPKTDHGRVIVRSPAGPLRLRVPSDEDTLPPDDTLDSFVVRLGNLEIHALACAHRPTELAWRIGPAVFTNRLLFAEGVWPQSATPIPVLRLPTAYAVYPRFRRGEQTISTVGREREWELTWRTRGYDPAVPDPSATVRPSAREKGPE